VAQHNSNHLPSLTVSATLESKRDTDIKNRLLDSVEGYVVHKDMAASVMLLYIWCSLILLTLGKTSGQVVKALRHSGGEAHVGKN